MRTWLSHLFVFALGIVITLLIQFTWSRGKAPAQGAVPIPKLDLSLADGATMRVSRVIDGDTVALENGLMIRYRGINAPESGHFIKDPSPFSEEATVRNRTLVEGKLVRLQLGDPPMDAYGRIIARLTLAEPGSTDADVEGVLLKEGLARILPLGLNTEDTQRFKEIEAQAKQEKRGLWGLNSPFADGPPAGIQYCAAENSKLFHRIDSPFAKRISGQHFVGYKTLEDAVCSGRSMATSSIKLLRKNAPAVATEPADEPEK